MYNFIRIFIIYPILFFVKLFSRDKRKFLNKRLKQDYSSLEKKEHIWVHCASMGEVNLSETLVKGILESRKEHVLLSVFTDTGYENAKGKYKNFPRVKVIYFPLDDLFAIKKIIGKIRLKLMIIIETELWPNLINQGSRECKVIMVNGRISDKSIGNYERYKFLIKGMIKKISKFYMQSELDCERITLLGAKSDRVVNLGNLKFCIDFERFTKEELGSFRESLNIGNRKLIVLGSTRDREEEKIVKATSYFKDKLLIFVPRHIERTAEVVEMLEKYRLRVVRYSELDKAPKGQEFDAIVVNKMGLLRKFYAVSDVAFVGGTLVNIGGHSLLEPLFYGKIPLFGKYYQNVKEIAKELLDRKLGVSINQAGAFEMAVNEILAMKSREEDIDDLFNKNSHLVKDLLKEIDGLI